MWWCDPVAGELTCRCRAVNARGDVVGEKCLARASVSRSQVVARKIGAGGLVVVVVGRDDDNVVCDGKWDGSWG